MGARVGTTCLEPFVPWGPSDSGTSRRATRGASLQLSLGPEAREDEPQAEKGGPALNGQLRVHTRSSEGQLGSVPSLGSCPECPVLRVSLEAMP